MQTVRRICFIQPLHGRGGGVVVGGVVGGSGGGGDSVGVAVVVGRGGALLNVHSTC